MNGGELPVLPDAMARWAEQSRVGVRPVAMDAARVAMHAARLAAQAPGRRRRFRLPLVPLANLQRHPMRLTAASMAAAATLVAGAGWNAGPGSPLHPIQLAREDASLVLATTTQAGDLRLDYAEGRLRDASSGNDRHDSLEEAAALLDAARRDLPEDHSGPLWLRWSHDEDVLRDLVAGGTSPSHGGSPANPRAPDDGSVPGAGSGDGGSSGDTKGGDDGGPSAGSATPAPGREGGGGGRGGDGGASAGGHTATSGDDGADGGSPSGR